MFIPLDHEKILAQLPRSLFEIIIKPIVDSTNTYLKGLENQSNYLVCIAEQQTRGRGRLNRTWLSPFGENIYCSIKLPYNGQLEKIAGFSLAICIGAHQILNELVQKEGLKIKWPNDLLYRGKKISGILIEIEKNLNNEISLIIGIGINVNMMTSSEDIIQAWTSLKAITGEELDRNEIVSSLLNHLTGTIEQFFKQGLEPFIEYYTKHDFLFDKVIKVENAAEVYQGKAKGIDASGRLQIETENQAIMSFCSGETQILK